ncbi:MAG: serine/threonine protein kinase [Phycisphaerae bacterium]|nr:serine/threonine protein kinase [Phycisphaerae bacterium]
MTQHIDPFPHLLKEARAIDPAKRDTWISELTVSNDMKQRLSRALEGDVTIAGTAPGTIHLQEPDGPAPDATIVTRGATLSERADADHDGDPTTPARHPSATDPMIGRTFAGVVIERVLGSGGMGRVYLGTDGPGGPAVALKVLLRTQRDDSMRKRFEREARLLKELQHPCIAQILRTGVEEDGDIDIPYIVMEYVDGVLSITDYVFRHRFGVRESAELFVQVCEALGFAHAQGYMHRDLKPQNILVNRQGRVKVIDFGVARAVAIDSASVTVRTEAGQIVGTMQYMSPEQFKADPRLVDKRSDVYALAAVLYELVSGIQPHELRGLPVHEAARIVCHADAPDVRQCNPRVDAGLATLLAEGLSREPSKRPDDAIAFGRRLKGWLSTPQPTNVATIHADHPDKVFDRQMSLSAGDGDGARRRRVAVPSRAASGGRKGSRGGWGAVTVVTGLLVVAVLVAFDVIPARQIVGKFREFTGTRTATADESPVLPKPAPGATFIQELRVVAAPVGASIRVNGEPKGVAPAVVLASMSRGGSIEIEVSKDGWQTASTRWTQGKDAPLAVLNLVENQPSDRLQRAVVMDVTGLPQGGRLRLKNPIRQALSTPVDAVVVDFFKNDGKWQPVTLEFDAVDANGAPLALQVGARWGSGTVSVDLVPDDVRHRLRVRIGEQARER